MLNTVLPSTFERSTDINATLAYSNHRTVAPHSDIILAKIFDDVRFGRSIIFPRSEAHTIPDLRLSPLAVVVSPSQNSQDLTFSSSQYARSVNADTDFAQAPSVELGHVLRNIIGRILYLRPRFGPRARIVLIRSTSRRRSDMLAYSGQEHPCLGTFFANWSWPIVSCSLDGGVRRGGFCMFFAALQHCLLYTSPSPRDGLLSRMPSSA